MTDHLRYHILMKTCGLIVEYNPFHNGHLYHLQKAKEISKADALVAVMSGNIAQRGDFSIINKFEKAKIALDHGIDLVVELPFFYSVQSATLFAKGAITILDLLKVDSVCFGSETNNIENLKDIASTPVDPDHLKESLALGLSYPKAYSLLASSLYPNDILAVAYLKELKDKSIEPLSIQRTSMYHDDKIKEIASAKAIRKAVVEGYDYHAATDVDIDHPLFLKDIYATIRQRLLLSDPEDIAKIHLVSEGIEKLLIKNAYRFDNFDDFIDNSISKRYTRSRIQRILMWIMLDIKESACPKYPLNYVRVLGFNEKGRQIIKEAKERGINIITNFKHIPSAYKDIEFKVTLFYALSFTDSAYTNYLIKRELMGPIII